jgi:N-acetylmuramoyl-L-alanine amidase
MMNSLISRPSPNFNERDPKISLFYIVVHYTDMENSEQAFSRLCDPDSKVSAHYLIEEDGRIFQLVDDAKRAWHAGASFWRGITDLNSASIGIELVNPGHTWGYRPFPLIQIEALTELLEHLCATHAFDRRTCMLAHSDIAPGRKQDPGELFPWQHLALKGFGVWPEPQPQDYGDISTAEVCRLLASIGYHCPLTMDQEGLRLVVTAFQRRYDPQHLSGLPEPETVARLKIIERMP